jgi:microcystin-dependent protein
MAKNKISEWSATPANNTDIGGIDIAEGCAPSGINNAIRELMAQVKDMQTGADGDNFTVGGNLTVNGTSTFTGSITFPSSVALVPTGVIVMWSGSIATIPSGWALCNGSNGTPDLRNRFIVGAGSTYSVADTGGTADAVVVSHTHTATSTVTDPGHIHNIYYVALGGGGGSAAVLDTVGTNQPSTVTATTGITVATTNSSTGVSGTNANLPPYYALAYIIKL